MHDLNNLSLRSKATGLSLVYRKKHTKIPIKYNKARGKPFTTDSSKNFKID